MRDDFSVSDLVEITGMKSRWVQSLAETDIIRPHTGTDRAGSGVHRRFARDEAIIACVIATFARRKMTVGSHKKISTALRDWLPSYGPPFIRNIREGHPCWMIVSWEGDRAEFQFLANPDDPSHELKFNDVFVGLLTDCTVADVINLTKILRDVV